MFNPKYLDKYYTIKTSSPGTSVHFYEYEFRADKIIFDFPQHVLNIGIYVIISDTDLNAFFDEFPHLDSVRAICISGAKTDIFIPWQKLPKLDIFVCVSHNVNMDEQIRALKYCAADSLPPDTPGIGQNIREPGTYTISAARKSAQLVVNADAKIQIEEKSRLEYLLLATNYDMFTYEEFAIEFPPSLIYLVTELPISAPDYKMIKILKTAYWADMRMLTRMFHSGLQELRIDFTEVADLRNSNELQLLMSLLPQNLEILSLNLSNLNFVYEDFADDLPVDLKYLEIRYRYCSNNDAKKWHKVKSGLQYLPEYSIKIA